MISRPFTLLAVTGRCITYLFKGSIGNYISHSLSAHKLVGHFSSPFLITPRDCIRVNTKSIDQNLYDKMTAKIRDVNLLNALGCTEFEILTSVAFACFSEMKVDIAVIEVGLGGLLDATNCIPPPLVCILTSISLDHTEFLGNTVQEIAVQKAGIIKPGVGAVVVAPQAYSECISVFQSASSCPVSLVTHEGITNIDKDDGINVGEGYQKENIATAVRALQLLAKMDSTFNFIPNVQMMLEIKLPGRLDWLTYKGKRILVDGAHNVSGAQALSLYIKSINVKNVTQNLISKDGLENLISKDGSQRSISKVPQNSIPKDSPQKSICQDAKEHVKMSKDSPQKPISQEGKELLKTAKDRPRKSNFKEENPLKVCWIFAASSTKDISSILSILVGPEDILIPVQFDTPEGMPWVKSKPIEEVKRLCQELKIQTIDANEEVVEVEEIKRASQELKIQTINVDEERSCQELKIQTIDANEEVVKEERACQELKMQTNNVDEEGDKEAQRMPQEVQSGMIEVQELKMQTIYVDEEGEKEAQRMPQEVQIEMIEVGAQVIEIKGTSKVGGDAKSGVEEERVCGQVERATEEEAKTKVCGQVERATQEEAKTKAYVQVERALEIANGMEGLTVVCGSLYLVSQVYRALKMQY